MATALQSIQSITDWASTNVPAPAQKTDTTWFRNESITGSNWNQLFPYQLIVVDQTDVGTYVPHRDVNGSAAEFQFTLPVPPEAFSISMPIAAHTSITLGGHVEEHNGAPVRMIEISGTTGMAFGRGNAPLPASFDFRNAVFSGTIQAAVNTANSAVQLVTTNFVNNTHTQDEYNIVSDLGALTGWYQFRLLQLFYESYVEFKKTREGRRSRLALATWKDEAVYLVTPITLDFNKDAGSPFEYRYRLSFKAFKRVRLERGRADVVKQYTTIKDDPGGLAKTLNFIQGARFVLQGAKKTLQAVGGDIDRMIFEPIRQTTLLVKDLLSVPLTVADVSDSLIFDFRDSIIQVLQTKQAANDFTKNVNRRFQQVTRNALQAQSDINSLAAETNDDLAVRTSPIVTANRDTHPANALFADPKDNFDFFSLINVGNLDLSPTLLSKIAVERQRARQLTRLDFQTMRNNIQATADRFAAAIGASHPTYNAIYGLEDPPSKIIDNPTEDDFNTLFYLNSLVMEMNRFTVTNNDDPKLNAIAVVAGLASQASIPFHVPRSKFAVPFPYQSTLEQLAYQYLGDPDRWLEIATLNGLQAPYVDEEGFQLPLVVNGAANTVFVSSDAHLYVGQSVYISSETVVRTRRTITKIDQLAPNQFMVTVDGNANMDQYTVLAHAKLEAFLPNTVNSQMVVYIPSDLEPKQEEFSSRTVPGINEFDSLIAVGGIDLLLTPAGDLVITPDGDSRWAVGLTNIVQKVRLALSVVQGTLNRHPEYGLPLEVGQSLADLNATEIARAAQGMFAGDPTFLGVKGTQVTVNGPLTNLNLAVEIAGINQVIPISAQVART